MYEIIKERTNDSNGECKVKVTGERLVSMAQDFEEVLERIEDSSFFRKTVKKIN